MSAVEERVQLMTHATQLQALLTEIRNALRPISQYVANLIAAGDSLMLQAADEIDKGEVKKVTVLKQIDLLDARSVATGVGAGLRDGEMLPDGRPMPAGMVLPTKPAKGKRACSLCRQPGHRAQNCPNAHTVRAQEKAAKEAPKPKQKRKPLSPERKAQLVETLKKARAARAKKGKK